MKLFKRSSFFIVVGFLAMFYFTLAAPAQKSATQKKIDEVRAVYRQGVRLQSDSTTTVLRFIRELRSDSSMPWKPIGSIDSGVDTLSVYMHDGTIASAVFALGSLSGDWTLRTELYYRARGTLAFVFENLRTFHGDVNAEKRIYLDSAATAFMEKRIAYDLKTGKATNREYRDKTGPRYRTAELLRKELGSSWQGQKK